MTEHQGDSPQQPSADTQHTTPLPEHATTPLPPLPPQYAQPVVAPAVGSQPPRQFAPPAGHYAGQAFGIAEPEAPVAEAPARKSSGAGKIVGLLVAAALVGGAAGLGGAAAGQSLFGTATPASVDTPTVVTINDGEDVTPATAIAAKVMPSTVTIAASGGSASGTGSGVIISEDGYVLTNTHVVTLDGATATPTLRVTATDGRVYTATVVGTDPTYDLAVIKLQGASGLTPIEFGDSAALNVGDETLAVGAPLGLANTVTTGIVSALNRSIEIASSAAPDASEQGDEGSGEQFRFDFGQGQSQTQTQSTIKISVIQTDAAINPGNSGGALVDDEGKLIGINVAIATAGSSSGSSSAAGSIGVGFAIPSAIAERIANELIENGSATHGLLGANVQNAATQTGSTITGAYISNVTAGGAAAAAGLQVGDTVTSFNGVPITSSIDLTAQVRALPAGATATVVYVRDGRTESAEVTLGSV